MLSRQYLDERAYANLTKSAKLLHEDRLGARVWQISPDEKILKLFYRRPGLSWDRVRPRSQRFIQNTRRLLQKHLNVPQVDAMFHIPHLQADAVRYPRLPGVTLREYFMHGVNDPDTIGALGRWIGRIHERGIYCKSLHLGNVLKNDSDEFALIDIGQVRFFRRPLPGKKRAFNLAKLTHKTEDREAMLRQDVNLFIRAYLETTSLDGDIQQAVFQPLLERLHQP